MWTFFVAVIAICLVLAQGHDFFGAQFDSPIESVFATTCVCTTVPCPVAGPNSLTVGGGAVGTYVYKLTTNNVAVVASASITITAADLDQGTDTTTCTQNYSRSMDDDGIQDCDAGHILANRLGGPGNQPINIFPQDSHVNRGTYAQFEGEIYACVAGGSKTASLSWSFDYGTAANTKPYQVTYNAVFGAGGSCTKLSQVFTN